MERDDDVAPARRQPDPLKKLCPGNCRLRQHQVEARTADNVDALRSLAELAHAPRGIRRGDEMQMRHMRDAMAKSVIDRTRGHIASRDMCDGDAGERCRERGAENFI